MFGSVYLPPSHFVWGEKRKESGQIGADPLSSLGAQQQEVVLITTLQP